MRVSSALVQLLSISAPAVTAGTLWTQGYCGLTFEGQGVSCQDDDNQGTWVEPSATKCRLHCIRCARCAFISWSDNFKDCSWFSRCNISQLDRSYATDHRTVQLRPALGRAMRVQTLLSSVEAGVKSGSSTAVVSFFIPPQSSSQSASAAQLVGPMALRNHLAYATQQGYLHLTTESCFGRKGALSSIRPAAWAKVFLLSRCFQRFADVGTMAWFDADVVIMNMQLPIEAIVAGTNSTQCSLIVARDEGAVFNTGVVILKNTKETLRLLHLTALGYNRSSVRHALMWEQTHMVHLHRLHAWVRQAICIVPRRHLQAFIKFDEFSMGDFAAHFTDSPKERIFEFMVTMSPRVT